MIKKFLTLFLLFFSLSVFAQCGGFGISLSGLTNSSTYLACDGSATVNVSGGTAPFSYYWFPGGQTTATVTSMCGAAHKVFVTDSVGCIDSIPFTVTSPPSPCYGFHLNISTTLASAPGTCDATVTAGITGGTPPFSYNWGYITPPSGMTATGVCTGNHYFAVTDSNGCFANSNYLVDAVGGCSTLAVVPSITNVSSSGTCDGAITLSVTGGKLPYSYDWYTISDTNSSLSAKCSGFYPVKVTDSAGCEAYAFPTIECPGFSITAASNDCPYKGCSEGSVYCFSTGGAAPYSYDWWWKWPSFPTYQSMGVPSTDTLISGYASTVKYIAIAQDANGCFSSGYTKVNEPSEPTPCDDMCATCNLLTVTYATDQFSCDGIVMPAAGFTPGISTPPYSYYWPATNSYSDQPDSTACANTSHLCVLTDSRGCQTFWPGFVGILNYVETTPLASDTTRAVCIGSASTTVASQFPPFTYLWDDGEASPVATNLCVGLRNVIVNDNQGTKDTAYVVISNIEHTYLNNQGLPSPVYVSVDPLDDCSIAYDSITNISIDTLTVTLPNKIDVSWRIDYTSMPSEYISKLYHVIPNGVVEFIIGIYCEADSNYVTARDRYNFGGITVGVQQITTTDTRIFPNPFLDEFTVRLGSLKGPANLIVTDQLGRVVVVQKLNDQVTKINTSGFSAGMYFVSVITAEGRSNYKLIKQ